MNTTRFNLKACLVLATMLAAPMAQAATLSKVEYEASKTRITADLKADKKLCDAQAGNAKDVCVE